MIPARTYWYEGIRSNDEVILGGGGAFYCPLDKVFLLGCQDAWMPRAARLHRVILDEHNTLGIFG